MWPLSVDHPFFVPSLLMTITGTLVVAAAASAMVGLQIAIQPPR